MRRKQSTFAGIMAAALLVTGCSAGSPESGESETPGTGIPARIGIQDSAWIAVMPLVADREGFFEDRGLDAELITVAGGPSALSALLAGELDVTFTSQSLTTPAEAQGECFQYVTTPTYSTSSIIGQPDMEWPNAGEGFPESLTDLVGKTVGVIATGGGHEKSLLMLLQAAGIDPATVTTVSTGAVSTAVPALQEGQVDALYAYPPMMQMMQDDEYVTLYNLMEDPNQPLGPLMNSGEIVSCETAEERPEMVSSYCAAIWDVYDFAQNEPAKMGEYVAELLGVSQDVAEEAWLALKPTVVSPVITQDSWDAGEKTLPDELQGAMKPFDEAVYAPCNAEDPRD